MSKLEDKNLKSSGFQIERVFFESVGFKRKDPGIPNSFPLKAQMLEEIRRQREVAIAERARKKLQEKERKKISAESEESRNNEAPEIPDEQDAT